MSENLWFSDVFRGKEMEHWAKMDYFQCFPVLCSIDTEKN